MADMVELTTTGADGKEVKFSVPQQAIFDLVKDTHLPKDAVAKDLDKRAAAIVKNKGLRSPDELFEDADFVAKVLEKHASKKGENDSAAAQQLKDALARQRQEFEAKELNPLKTTLEAKDERERSLLIRDLERQIIQAAAPYVKEGLLKGQKGRPLPIVTLLEDAFAYDEESNEFYVADGDNFVISGSGNSTYKTVDEYVQEWLADKANSDWLKPGQAGADARGHAGTGGRAAGEVVLSREEASDVRTYAEALKRVGGDHSKIRVATH